MRQKTRKALVGLLAVASIACCAFAGAASYTPSQPITEVVAESTSATRMNIQSGEFVWNSTTGIRTMNADSYTAGVDGYVGNNGLDLITGTKYPTTASVLHCPETAIGTYTISLSNTYFRRYSGASKMRFRIVKNNEIVYPADGGWADCGAVNEEVKATGSLTMKAGDDLYFIANDEAVKGDGAAIWVQAGMTINGVWFDATVANHVNSANDSKTTSSYFDGTYSYSELFTYEYITSWYDYEEADNSGFGNYQKRTVKASVEFTASGAKELWPAYNVDMRGAEYFTFAIDNSAGTEDLKFVNRFRERGTASGDWGLFWSMTNNAEYFLLNENNILSRHDTVLTSNNDGSLTVPAGFKGQVLVPITSYEITSWQLPAVDSHYKRYVKFGEPTTPHLQMLYCLEFGLADTPASAVTVTDVQFWGSDLLTTYVSDTYQTAIQAIDNIGVVTAASANQIIKAQTLYNKLSDANKAKVSNYATLTAAIEAYKNLSDMSVYVGTYGKDFTDTEGVAFDSVVSESPSSVSAWIKVDKDIADGTHVGTIVGNMERTGSNAVFDSTSTMSMEITTYGRPKFIWRKSKTEKVNFVVENVDVRTGNWLNVTFVRDTVNNQLHCYIDGIKVASKSVDAADIADITFVNKPFMIGSDYTNDPVTAPGFTPDFNGCIANVKLYSGILTDEQVKSNLKAGVEEQGLLHDISFRADDDGIYYDNAANVEAVDSQVWIDNGAEQLKLGDYSFAILGDTQMMLSRAEDANGKSLYATDYDYTSNVFYKNVQWLIANKEELNLQFVMHVGDLTDSGNVNTKIDTTLGSPYTYKYEQEFVYAIDWMSDLRENGIPYALARGNHETVDRYESYYTAEANAQYTTADVTTTAEDGTETTVTGMYSSSSMRDVAYTLNVGNQKYLIVVLDYEPTNDELAWANAVVAAHPTHRTIILTHKYMSGSNVRYSSADIGTNYGEKIWSELVSQHANIVMVVSGHASSPQVGRRVDTGVNGNKVLQLMVDESLIEYSGSRQTGVFALLGFENDGNTVHFNFYSPSEDKLFRMYNQFTVELDDDYFNDKNAGKTDYAKQEDLPLAIKPNFVAYPVWGESGFSTGTNGTTASSFSKTGFTLRRAHMEAVNLHMSADGIFYFNDASYLDVRKTHKNACNMRVEVYVSNQDGTTRKVFPTRDGYYTIDKTWGVWYLSQIGGVEVKSGDTITVAFETLDNALYCYGRFDGRIKNEIGETLVTYTLKAGYGSCSVADLTAIHDGTKTDYSVGYVSHYGSYVFEKTLTIVDLEGNTVQTIPAGKNGYYVLPELSRAGHVLAGYIVDGTLLPVGSTIQVTADTTITAAFVELSMFNGASVRVKVPTGIRFSTQIKQSQYAQLSGVGATVSFGTLIVMASDITANEALDYTLLTKGCNIKHLDVVSTVQVVSGEYTQFNGVVVGIKESNISKKFAARSYMQITYANGETVILYANVQNNARSVVEVAEKALADVNTLQTKDYQYETDNGYSPYSLYEQEVIGKLKNGDLSLTPLTNEMKDETYMHVLDASHISGYTLGGAGFTVLFEYQDQVVMIDTAWNAEPSTSRINEYLRERGINRIDHLIITHMHSDHAGGVPYFVENYDVGTIYMKPFDFQYSNTGEKDAEYYELALKAAQRKVNSTGEAVTIIEPNVEGYTVELGEDTFFSIYNCTEIFETTTQLDGNTFSMMVYFKSGTATAFVGADSTSLADEFVLGNIGQVDVYTLQHHGTNGPYSSAELLAELQPTYSVSTTSPNELDKDNGDGVYDTSDGQRVRCEAYGQVINPYNDGNRYFKIIDGKFVLQGDLESRWVNAQTVQITETEIAYTASGRVTEDGNFVGNSNGTLVGAGKTTATALVLTVPESFPSTATVTLDDSVLYKVVGENARFRIVLNDKVVYPTQDGWLDFSDSSSENKVLIDLRLTVKAGDKLYFIVDGIDENGVQTQAYMTMGLRIDGLWWDVVNVLHLNEADDNMPAAKNFFNGTLYNGGVYARKDLISYMQVIVEDIEEE